MAKVLKVVRFSGAPLSTPFALTPNPLSQCARRGGSLLGQAFSLLPAPRGGVPALWVALGMKGVRRRAGNVESAHRRRSNGLKQSRRRDA